MRKCRFITGTISLTLSIVVAVTSFAQLSGSIGTNEFVYEYETNVSEPIVERSANEVNVLMDAGLNRKDAGIKLELETTVVTIENVAKEAAQAVALKNSNTESQSKKATAKKAKQKSDKKNTAKNETETKKENKKTKESDKDNLKKLGNFKITAYCSCSRCCGKSNGITASGTKAKAGRTIAADTSVIPFGTKVVIDGHTYTVEDRGGAINGNRIDVYFNSHSEALNWGVKYREVYIKK